jgi:hypothetical protein
MRNQQRRTQSQSKPPKLTISNGTILSLPAPVLSAAMGAFLAQPLPVLARLDLKMVCDAIVARARTLADAHLELIKKHGGTEAPAGSGSWEIKTDHKNYAAFTAEWQTLCAARSPLPLPSKVKLPAKVLYQGKEVDLVMDGASAVLFDEIVEVSR